MKGFKSIEDGASLLEGLLGKGQWHGRTAIYVSRLGYWDTCLEQEALKADLS